MKAILFVLAALALAIVGCQGRVDRTSSSHAEEDEGWAVTAWGEHYEIFAEADPLVVGSVSKSHTHVTILDGFPPLKEGSVAAILRDPQGREHAYRQETALRDGIYSIEIKPASAGTFDLFFAVESAAGTERIAAGTVHVAEGDSAGGLVAAPRYGSDSTRFVPAGEPVGFLKEQQWRIPFATEWAHRGVVRRTVSGPARIRPAAGGEALLVAPVAGIVASTSGTFVGMDVGRNTTVIRLTPRVSSDRSVAEIRSELGLARSRVKRLEELFEVEAVSVADLEEARARVRTLASEAAAAGGGAGEPIAVRSPLAGRVAEVAVVPGQAVDAGDPLARIVRPNPLWIEVALSPADAGAVGSNLAGVVVRPPGNVPPVTLSQVRLVSRSPEVDRSTGSIGLIVEARTGPTLSPGMAVTADVLLPNEREGIVLPATAVIDDGGVPVVYVQLDGESFVRQEVRVLATEGERVLVEGIAEWTRVVTLGGAAIRRAALLRSGPPEGHVH